MRRTKERRRQLNESSSQATQRKAQAESSLVSYKHTHKSILTAQKFQVRRSELQLKHRLLHLHPMQVPAFIPGKAAEDAPSPWPLAATGETQLGFLDPGSSQTSPGYCSHLQSKSVDGISVCLPFSLFG